MICHAHGNGNRAGHGPGWRRSAADWTAPTTPIGDEIGIATDEPGTVRSIAIGVGSGIVDVWWICLVIGIGDVSWICLGIGTGDVSRICLGIGIGDVPWSDVSWICLGTRIHAEPWTCPGRRIRIDASTRTDAASGIFEEMLMGTVIDAIESASVTATVAV